MICEMGIDMQWVRTGCDMCYGSGLGPTCCDADGPSWIKPALDGVGLMDGVGLVDGVGLSGGLVLRVGQCRCPSFCSEVSRMQML